MLLSKHSKFDDQSSRVNASLTTFRSLALCLQSQSLLITNARLKKSFTDSHTFYQDFRSIVHLQSDVRTSFTSLEHTLTSYIYKSTHNIFRPALHNLFTEGTGFTLWLTEYTNHLVSNVSRRTRHTLLN